jgi:hypothetical protein
VERFLAAREMASKRFRFYFILARTPLDATIIVSVRFTTGNRVVATRTAVKRSLRDQRANQRRCTSEPHERFHSATGGWESDRAFATTDALGTRRSLSKRDAQRVKRAGISIVADGFDAASHTLLVAAILAPLRRFDT